MSSFIDSISDFTPLADRVDLVEVLSELGDSYNVSTTGAKITRVKLDGRVLLTGVRRADGQFVYTHPCTPNFGPEVPPKFSLPRHGTGRSTTWEIEKQGTISDPATILRTAITGGTYPQGLVARQEFALRNGVFQMVTTHVNTGEKVMPVNFGEHFYFWTNFVGWDNLTINGQRVADLVRSTGMVELGQENIIQIPKAFTINLRQKGLGHAVLWAAQNGESFDRHYVCIEPIEGNPSTFFGSEESFIQPGSERTTEVNIQLIDKGE